MGHYKVQYLGLCSVQQVWRSLRWVLQPGWAGGLWLVAVLQYFRFLRPYSTSTTVHRALPVCEWPALGMPWATASANEPLQQCLAGELEPALGAAARLGRWLVWGAGLLNARVFQVWRYCSATTAHRAPPVCDGPALGISWATARSNAASTVRRRCGGACTGCCGRVGQVVCGWSRFC